MLIKRPIYMYFLSISRCTTYNVRRTLYIVYCKMFDMSHSMYGVLYILYGIRCTAFITIVFFCNKPTVQALHTLRRTSFLLGLRLPQYTVCRIVRDVQCTAYTVRRRVYGVHYVFRYFYLTRNTHTHASNSQHQPLPF